MLRPRKIKVYIYVADMFVASVLGDPMPEMDGILPICNFESIHLLIRGNLVSMRPFLPHELHLLVWAR